MSEFEDSRSDQFVKNLSKINIKFFFRVFPSFPSVIIDLFMKFKLSIPNLIPLLKGLKTLVLFSSNDTKIFRTLVPKLRSFLPNEPNNQKESDRIPFLH